MRRKGFLVACILSSCFMLNGCGDNTNKTVNQMEESGEVTTIPMEGEPTQQALTPTQGLTQPTQEIQPTAEPITTQTQEKNEAELLFDQYIESSLDGSYIDTSTMKEEELQLFRKFKTTNNEFEKFEGTWNRTNCMNSYSGQITISDVTKDGFNADGGFFYFSHTGALEQASGYFINDTKAVIEYSCFEENPSCLILLDLEGDNLQVVGIGGQDFGFGANVSIDGTYTQKEINYTNSNALDDNFTTVEQNRMKDLLTNSGFDYEDLFLFPVQYGVIEKENVTVVFDDEREKTGNYYRCFVPTMGEYSFELFLSDDGYAYCNYSMKDFLTDDPNATAMPQIKKN